MINITFMLSGTFGSIGSNFMAWGARLSKLLDMLEVIYWFLFKCRKLLFMYSSKRIHLFVLSFYIGKGLFFYRIINAYNNILNKTVILELYFGIMNL